MTQEQIMAELEMAVEALKHYENVIRRLGHDPEGDGPFAIVLPSERVRKAVDELKADHARYAGGESEQVAEVANKYGDPESFGEREIKLLADIQKMPYGTKLYAQPVGHAGGGEAVGYYNPKEAREELAFSFSPEDGYLPVFISPAPAVLESPPYEPTDKMLAAAARLFPGSGVSQYAPALWKAMLTASKNNP